MRAALVLLLLVPACDSPTPLVAGWQKATVEQGGMRFGLHWSRSEERAEIYRISRHVMPRRSVVAEQGALALQRASGCRVRPGTVTGDAALLKARLSCR